MSNYISLRCYVLVNKILLKLLQCKQLLIPAGFWVDENENVYTPEISVLYRLATNKKDLPEAEKSFLVAGVGFEPTTFWL